MSYVRWSNRDSDVYVYEDVMGGWTTHVAGGGSYSDPTPGDCADRLEALRLEGVRVPQFAIDALREEHEEEWGE